MMVIVVVLLNTIRWTQLVGDQRGVETTMMSLINQGAS